MTACCAQLSRRCNRCFDTAALLPAVGTLYTGLAEIALRPSGEIYKFIDIA